MNDASIKFHANGSDWLVMFLGLQSNISNPKSITCSYFYQYGYVCIPHLKYRDGQCLAIWIHICVGDVDLTVEGKGNPKI